VALTPVDVPRYPNVPQAPGVPPLQRASQVLNTVSLLVADVLNVLDMFSGPRWGIFDEEGAPLLIGDSVLNVDYKQEARMSDFPVEKGQFASYNKVQLPYDARVSFAVGGTEDDRAAFLANVQKLILTLQMVSVVTPEVTYESANVTHYDYRRSSRAGVTLVVIEVWVQEVRQVAATAFTDNTPNEPTAPTDTTGPAPTTQQPEGAAPTSGSVVSPATPTPAQTTAAGAQAAPTGGGPQ